MEKVSISHCNILGGFLFIETHWKSTFRKIGSKYCSTHNSLYNEAIKKKVGLNDRINCLFFYIFWFKTYFHRKTVKVRENIDPHTIKQKQWRKSLGIARRGVKKHICHRINNKRMMRSGSLIELLSFEIPTYEGKDDQWGWLQLNSAVASIRQIEQET